MTNYSPGFYFISVTFHRQFTGRDRLFSHLYLNLQHSLKLSTSEIKVNTSSVAVKLQHTLLNSFRAENLLFAAFLQVINMIYDEAGNQVLDISILFRKFDSIIAIELLYLQQSCNHSNQIRKYSPNVLKFFCFYQQHQILKNNGQLLFSSFPRHLQLV